MINVPVTQNKQIATKIHLKPKGMKIFLIWIQKRVLDIENKLELQLKTG